MNSIDVQGSKREVVSLFRLFQEQIGLILEEETEKPGFKVTDENQLVVFGLMWMNRVYTSSHLNKEDSGLLIRHFLKQSQHLKRDNLDFTQEFINSEGFNNRMYY